MAGYIGTATSRVDGRAKVTGEARYAGEFNVPGLVHGYVVESTIPKGRILRIDASGAGFVLTPFYKFFEYKAEGSLSHPTWRPKNF